nr:C-type lectin [Glycymeris yessoensis]
MKFTALIVVMAGLQWCIVVAADECDAGWQFYGDSCYLFNKTRVTPTVAKNFCRTQAGYLAQPTNEGIHTFLKETAKQLEAGSAANYWIGGSDLTTEGQWQWLNNEKCFSYTGWDAGEPNDNDIEDCLELRADREYRWNDEHCWSTRFFICEKLTEKCTSK